MDVPPLDFVMTFTEWFFKTDIRLRFIYAALLVIFITGWLFVILPHAAIPGLVFQTVIGVIVLIGSAIAYAEKHW
jgi:hypothetical protein